MAKRNTGYKLQFRDERQIYEIVWFERGKRKRQSTATSNLEEAQDFLQEFLYTRNRPVGPADPSKRLIGHVLSDYLLERGQHVNSAETTVFGIQNLEPFWADQPVSVIREGTCRAYMDYRQKEKRKKDIERIKKANPKIRNSELEALIKPLSPSTIARELSILGAAINHDYKAGRITSPRYVWQPKGGEKKERWLTRQEAAALLKAARAEEKVRDYLPLFILIGLYTGARKGAILSLRWVQVDLERGLIDFNPPGRARTSKGRPIIPIPKRLLRFLKYARKQGTDLGYVIHKNQAPLQDIKKGFAHAVRRAGLEKVTPHTLRHTVSSWLVQNRVDMHIVSRYVGHKSIKMTEQIYAHHAPDYLKAAADSFDNFAAHLKGPQRTGSFTAPMTAPTRKYENADSV